MVRDEEDLLDIWLNQLGAIFHKVVLIDHCSVESNSRTMKIWCAKTNNLYIRLNNEAYIQTAVFNVIADLITRDNQRNIWLYPVDADEFFTRRTLQTLEKICKFSGNAISLPWRNAFPSPIPKNLVTLDMTKDITIFTRMSTVNKVIINTNLVREKGARWLAGNHTVVTTEGEFIHTDKFHNAFILHVPIRSGMQFEAKVRKGNEAYNQLRKYRKRKKLGFHWQVDLNESHSGSLKSMVCYYSESQSQHVKSHNRSTLTMSLKNLLQDM
jgi:hypothetical protein